MANIFKYDTHCDIRNYEELEIQFKKVDPGQLFTWQPGRQLGESYKDSIKTFETNMMGTINILKASQSLPNLKAQLIITTDKVYKNIDKKTGYAESDPLGGSDPYSPSKAMADIATQSQLFSFGNVPTAIARAGNVIAGGDASSHRLIPDLVNSYASNLIPKLCSPNAVRPWQHVLDCLSGYLELVDALLAGTGTGEWNFGPEETEIRTVADVADMAGAVQGAQTAWETDSGEYPHEARLLLLNSGKARSQLGWIDKLNFEESIA